MEENYKILEEVKSGVSKQSILQSILSCEPDVRNKVISYEYLKKKSSKICDNSGDNMVLDAAVLKWFKQATDRGDPISGPMIKEKACILNEELNGPKTFKASEGWFDRFKKRNGIRNIQMKGETLLNDSVAAAKFSEIFKAKIESENLSLDNIYNADVTGIAWRLLTACTLALYKEELEASRRKEYEDHVTALFCANATGSHRIPLLTIGKSKTPECLRNLITKNLEDQRLKNLKSLGVIYTYQNNAWMDTDIFMLWFKNVFIPRVLEYQRTRRKGKVVLLLDNAPSRPSLDELNTVHGNFEVVYLFPNVTALIQPMRQGIITTTKKLFKKNLLRRLLFSKKSEATKFLKELNLRDCFGRLNFAWKDVTSSTLQKAWKPLLGDLLSLKSVPELCPNSVPVPDNIQDPLYIQPKVDELESPTDLISFPYGISDKISELLAGPDYSVEESREFLLKWFENSEQSDTNCGWEPLSDSDENFVTNSRWVPKITTEIECVENSEQSDTDCGWELLSDSDVNFVTNVRWVPKTTTEIECVENNEQSNTDCGWEPLSDSDVNFVTNGRWVPKITTEIECVENSEQSNTDCGWEPLPDSDINFVTNGRWVPKITTEIECVENNEQSDTDCGWEPLSDSDVNFVTNGRWVPKITTEIEKSQAVFENPEPMEITTSEAFDSLMKFKNWLKSCPECLPKHLDYVEELENVMTEKLRLALVQLSVGDDKTENISRAVSFIERAKKRGADIVTLPECFSSPYGTAHFSQYAETIPNGETCNALSEAAKKNEVYVIGGTITEKDGDKLYNTATIWDPQGKLIAKYRQMHLLDIDIKGKITVRKSDFLSPGDWMTTFEVKGCKIGVGVCNDIRFDEHARLYRNQGCQLLIYPGAFNTTTGPLHWSLLQRSRANDLQCYIACVAPAKRIRTNLLVFDWAHTQLTNPWGTILQELEDHEDMIVEDIDLKLVEEVRSNIPVFDQRRIDLYDTISKKP